MTQCSATWEPRVCLLDTDHGGPHFDYLFGDWANVEDRINKLVNETVAALEDMGNQIEYRWRNMADEFSRQINAKCRVVFHWTAVGIPELLSGCKTGDDMKNQLIAFGSDPMGNGSYRTVFDLGDSVLKIDRRSENNAREIELWDEIKDTEDAKYFGRILAHSDDGRWLIMEKIAVLASELGERAPQDVYEAAKRYKVTDLHGANFGKRSDGSWCIIDYGFNKFGDW